MDSSTRGGSVRTLLEQRHSCRAFLAEPLPAEVVVDLLETAQRSASWCNTQPWQVVVTSGDETEAFRKRLCEPADHADRTKQRYDIPQPIEYVGEYETRRRQAGLALYDALGIEHSDRAARRAQGLRNLEFFGAPHVAVITAPRSLGPYGWVDCGGWVATFLLAAADRGIGAIAQGSVVAHSPVVREHLDISDDRDLVCAVSFGYEDPHHPANAFRAARAPISEAVTMRGF